MSNRENDKLEDRVDKVWNVKICYDDMVDIVGDVLIAAGVGLPRDREIDKYDEIITKWLDCVSR